MTLAEKVLDELVVDGGEETRHELVYLEALNLVRQISKYIFDTTISPNNPPQFLHIATDKYQSVGIRVEKLWRNFSLLFQFVRLFQLVKLGHDVVELEFISEDVAIDQRVSLDDLNALRVQLTKPLINGLRPNNVLRDLKYNQMNTVDVVPATIALA